MPRWRSIFSTSTRLKMSAQLSSVGDAHAGARAAWRARRGPARRPAPSATSPADRCRRTVRMPRRRVSRSGSANGSAARPRKVSCFVPAAVAASARMRGAVGHQRLVGLAGAVPFEHREFRMVQRAALAVAADAWRIRRCAARRPPAASCRRTPARCADRACRRAVRAIEPRWRRRADAPRCPARPARPRSRPRRNHAR